MQSTPVTSQRRVLGEINVNKGTPSMLATPGGRAKALLILDEEVLTALPPTKDTVVGRKRSLDLDDLPSAQKKSRRDSGAASAPETRSLVDQSRSLSETTAIAGNVVDPRPLSKEAWQSTSASQSSSALPPSPPSTSGSTPTSPRSSASSVMALESSTPTEAKVTPDTAKSRAEILRLRLKLAMFRIQTDQVGVPFAALHVSPRSSGRALSAEKLSSDGTHRSPLRRKLLPPPVILSTGCPTVEISLPSSPPDSANRLDDAMDDRGGFTTPVAPRNRCTQQPVQLSSPPDSQGGDERVPEINLTSSVVRGRAATGLLELKRMG
ncbi:MAG: hypothetical protein M1838_000437 [Thelocarpon superellum]|nr:MAG: hypothetical protein M1838_000437 [Thelocarpon superellum]